MANCVFCGAVVRKADRTMEHVLPMWLLEATGDPNRQFRLWADPHSADEAMRPASTFKFPACHECNQTYGRRLETQARKIVLALCEGRSITVANAYRLLDWLDKVRIGLWLGYQMLHPEGDFEPRFHIDTRLGRKDRIAIIAVDPGDSSKCLTFGGTDNNLFRLSQCGLFLRINNMRILSMSGDFLLSREVGLPHADVMHLVSGMPGFLTTSLQTSDYALSQDWSAFTKVGGTILAQPIVDLRFGDPRRMINLYCNSKVLQRAKDVFRANGIDQFMRIIPLQLITNANGQFRYHSNKRQRISIANAATNDDAAFLRLLYQLMIDRSLRRFPKEIVLPDGKTVAWFPGWWTVYLCLWQLSTRLLALGMPFPLANDIIQELQRFNRILEEQYADANGTLVSEAPLIDGRSKKPE